MEKHQRDSYEHASDLTNQINRLIHAAETVADDINHTPKQIKQADALFVLLNIAQEKVAELEKAHQMIWVGLGGKSFSLTDDEISIARGEVA